MTGPMWLRVAASIALTAVASVVSYHALEEPLIEYGRRVGHRLAPPPAAKAIAQTVGVA
jgi:peptidoglycan/LPS O-acetylase OafA/YrhL